MIIAQTFDGHQTLQLLIMGEVNLAHSALPDAEANVIRNLMERIDELENTVNALRSCLDDVASDCASQDDRGGEAQSLKDREILEFLGETSG